MKATRTERLTFPAREDLATALAGRVAEQLAQAIAARDRASLAVSGGSTPKLFFEALSQAEIDWPKVTVTLVDDRVVPPDNDRSNEKLVRLHLLKGQAADAGFVPLWSDGSEAIVRLAEHAAGRIDRIPRPFDVVVLGMGADGHTASFFPGGSHLRAALDREGETSVVSMTAPGAGEPRLTITLPRLVEAAMLVLHIEGEEKKRVLDIACAGGPAEEMPIRAILEHAPEPVTVYWAP